MADRSASEPLLDHADCDHPATSERPTIFAPPQSTPETTTHLTFRQRVQLFLGSKVQHFCVLTLVSLDLLGIFADIFINLYTCEEGQPSPELDRTREILNLIGLVFSCIFMLELLLSIWAFRAQYFQSKFRIFDAFVIVAGFVVDVLLHGILEEVASLVVILRLWRFFKILEEFVSGAQEQMDGLSTRIEELECENRELKGKLVAGKRADEESEIGS